MILWPSRARPRYATNSIASGVTGDSPLANPTSFTRRCLKLVTPVLLQRVASTSGRAPAGYLTNQPKINPDRVLNTVTSAT